jgi:DNA-binding FadR family transcriptional regulator
VARELAEVILANAARLGLGPGDRLPTERGLADTLGASRTEVRHALAALQADGRVSREVGRGTYLVGPPGQDAAGLHDIAPADVMAVRRLFEPRVLPLVVAWATASDIEEMRRCLGGGDVADTYDDFEVWDLALHRSIVVAAHSPLLLRLYEVVEAAREGQLWGDLKRRTDSRTRRARYQTDHRAIVDALVARDAEAAVAAMTAHLSHVEAALLGSA